jgi:hypothetical protein
MPRFTYHRRGDEVGREQQATKSARGTSHKRAAGWGFRRVGRGRFRPLLYIIPAGPHVKPRPRVRRLGHLDQLDLKRQIPTGQGMIRIQNNGRGRDVRDHGRDSAAVLALKFQLLPDLGFQVLGKSFSIE